MKMRSPLAVLILASVLMFASPIMRPGNFQGHETPLKTIWRLSQLDVDIKTHAWPPRRAPGFCAGGGTPFFIFYPPLFLYIAEGLHLAGAGYSLALDGAVFILIVSAAVGMYLFARQIWGPAGAVLSAVAYVLFPYRIVQLYIRGAYAEFAAGCVLPWAFWSGYRFLETGRRRAGAVAGLCVAFVFLGHNVITLFFVPLFILWGIILGKTGSFAKRMPMAAVWFFLGAAATAWFWAPALRELPFVSIGTMRSGYFDIGVHFAYPHQLFGSLWGFGPSRAGPDDSISFQIGVLLLPAAVLSFLMHHSHRDSVVRRSVGFWFIAAAFFIFLNLHVSEPVWRVIPGLSFSQFPWRSLTLLALPLAFLVGGLVGKDVVNPKRIHVSGAAVISLILMAYSGPYIQAPGYADLEKVDVSREMFLRNWITTTASGEYIPRWVPPGNRGHIRRKKEPALILSGDGVVHSFSERKSRIFLDITAHTALTIRIHRFFYPGWRAESGGLSLDVKPGPEGYILVVVPKGSETVKLWFGETRFRAMADGLSISALIVLLAGCLLPERPKVC